MNRRLLWTAVSSTLIALSCAEAADEVVRLVRSGTTGSVVVPADMRTGSEAFRAAVEVSEYVAKITGSKLPVVAEGRGVYRRVGRNRRVVPFSDKAPKPSGAPEVHVGWTSRAQGVLDRGKVEALDIDGFLIKTTPEAVFLVGPRDWSTAYACFTFLEELCGVRWYLPGDFGEDVPRRSELAVPLLDKTYEPAYKHRQYSGFQWRNRHELQRWGAHRKVRPRLQYHHNLYRVFDVKKYGKLHPDLYPIIGGRRRIPGAGNRSGWQPCLTHPKAIEIAVDYAREFFARQPDASSISLGITDGGGYCECPRCLKLVDESLPDEGQRSVWFFGFANAVSERFDELFPDKLIGYLLYGKCKMFPENMKIHPRLIGFYVSPSFQLITEEGRQRFDEGLAELTKHVSRFALYDWFYGDSMVIPRLQIRQAKYWLEHGYNLGARHIKAEAYMNWGLDGFKYWMHAKLMWDPTLDVDAMLEEFSTRFFKESAAPMRKYFEVVERYTVTPVLRPFQTEEGEKMLAVNFRFRRPEQLLSFPPEAVAECEPFLDEAAKRATSHLVRDRVRYFRAAFNVARMMTLRYHHAAEALPLVQDPKTLPEGMALLAQAMAKDLDVEQYYKWVLADDEFCVRYPPESMFGGVTRARGEAGAALSLMVLDELRRRGPTRITVVDVDEAAKRALGQALAQLADTDAARVMQLEVAPSVKKIVVCDKAKAPHIDGKLYDACWRNAQVYGGLAQLGVGKPAEHPTDFRVAHDGSKLYLAAQCRQDTSTLLAWTKERDGRVWREDGIELLLNRATDTTKEERFQVIVNTTGNIFDYYNGSADWDGDIDVAVEISPKHYTIELSVPLKEIGVNPARERFMRMNLARNVYARKELSTGEAKELSGWYLTPFGNLDPRARGWIVFNP